MLELELRGARWGTTPQKVRGHGRTDKKKKYWDTAQATSQRALPEFLRPHQHTDRWSLGCTLSISLGAEMEDVFTGAVTLSSTASTVRMESTVPARSQISAHARLERVRVPRRPQDCSGHLSIFESRSGACEQRGAARCC